MRYFKGIDYVRENIKCPQLGSGSYGKWGALPLEVRYTLYEICELVESQDYIIKELKDQKKKAIEYIENHLYKWYDLNGEEWVEPTEFDRDINPDELLKILGDDKDEENKKRN